MLTDYLWNVKDHRQNQGKRYQLHHILLFSIFAILCNADSYRNIHSFIRASARINSAQEKQELK